MRNKLSSINLAAELIHTISYGVRYRLPFPWAHKVCEIMKIYVEDIYCNYRDKRNCILLIIKQLLAFLNHFTVVIDLGETLILHRLLVILIKIINK